MPRSDNLKALYTNLLEGSAPIHEVLQRRIHRYALRTKDADLGAGLARRSDTVAAIDDELAGWAVARVQSAWFARPGRDVGQVAARLREERRVTVLEVGASTEGLDQDLYRTFAAIDRPRIAMRLLGNPSVEPSTLATAAQTLGAAYDELSYTKRHEVLTALRECNIDVIGAFVESLSELTTVTRLLGDFPQLPERAVAHVYALCRKELTTVLPLEAEVRKSRNKSSYWRTPYLEVVDTVADTLDALNDSSPDRAALEDDLRVLLHHFKKRGNQEADIVERISSVLIDDDGEQTPARTRAHQATHAGSTQQLNLLLDSWIAADIELDLHTVKALLTNAHVDVAIVTKAVEAMHWRYRPHSAWASCDVRTDILGAYMAATWQTSDDDIDRYAAGRDATDLWQAIVLADSRTGGCVSTHLLESKYAAAHVVPKLPFAVLTQSDVPAWVNAAAVAYLERNLTNEQEWDGFEILAKSHLGTFEQLVRGAQHATKRSR